MKVLLDIRGRTSGILMDKIALTTVGTDMFPLFGVYDEVILELTRKFERLVAVRTWKLAQF